MPSVVTVQELSKTRCRRRLADKNGGRQGVALVVDSAADLQPYSIHTLINDEW